MEDKKEEKELIKRMEIDSKIFKEVKEIMKPYKKMSKKKLLLIIYAIQYNSIHDKYKEK